MNTALEVRDFQVLETVKLGAPLGLRFVDELTGRLVSDGLGLRVALAAVPQRPLNAIAVSTSPSGAFQLRRLPGRRAFELGVAPDAQPPPIIVEVIDTLDRFLPFRLELDGTRKGLLGWPDERAQPQAPPQPFPLLSAPGRPVPTGFAAAHALVHESPAAGAIGAPATWAVMEAWLAGWRLGRGVTNDAGVLTLMMPYPDALSDPLGSPPGSLLALDKQEWSIELRAFYGEGGSPPADLRTEPTPLLDALLSQPAAKLWADVGHVQPRTHATLRFGQELILRTSAADGTPLDKLLISPTP